ncbi:hypothetical protein RJ640_009412 [Escallonia rubra]|uniref:Uncharacterized protein n=1 Tax=Escallonia rubra TaxID=112253 RepID=A0AA88QDY5_9ASTE|nr:hypothetical protein RJ640_009412 [Escallonia rubra]
MPPRPPPHLAAAVLLLIFATGTTGHTCSTPPSPCPPFASTPPFPFSLSPGCGHPSFHIKCATPRATISINNLTFSLLRFEPNSTSLLLSPQPADTTTTHRNCTPSCPLSIPTKPINLSASPFHVSDSSCSRLSVLKPCPPPNLPNCSHCSWQCKLIKDPVQLLHESCGSASTHPQLSEQGCQADILDFLDNFLTWGIEIEWDENQDTYFSKCKDCQSNSGICAYNLHFLLRLSSGSRWRISSTSLQSESNSWRIVGRRWCCGGRLVAVSWWRGGPVVVVVTAVGRWSSLHVNWRGIGR